MRRRNFLSSSLASLIAALTPWRSDTCQMSTAIIEKNACPEILPRGKRIFASYVAEHGVVLPQSEDGAGLLFQGMVLGIEIFGGNKQTAKVEGSFRRLIGPKVLCDRFCTRHSDVATCHQKRFILGLTEHKLVEPEDYVIVNITKPILTQLGCGAYNDQFCVIENVHFIACGEPFGGKLKDKDQWISDFKDCNKVVQTQRVSIDDIDYQVHANKRQMYERWKAWMMQSPERYALPTHIA